MSKNKRQHYIPRMIMRRFLTATAAGERVYRFERGGTRGLAVGISQAAAENYYYRDNVDPVRPDQLDDYLNETESSIGPVLTRICDRKILPTRETDEFELLIRFIHDSLFRNPSRRSDLGILGLKIASEIESGPWFKDNSDSLYKQLAQLDSGSPNDRYLIEMFRPNLEDARSLSEEAQKVLHGTTMSLPRVKILSQLRRTHWRILVAKPPGPLFIIGDEPVVIHDEGGEIRTGLVHAQTRVTFPVAPTIALQGCRSELFQVVRYLEPHSVRTINGLTARAAFREVYSQTPEFSWSSRFGRVFSSSDWMKSVAQTR